MRTRLLDKVVDALGGPMAAARTFGIHPQAVYMWRQIPIKRVLDIEALTGIPRHELRPDIYPPPSYRPSQRAA